MRTLKLLPFFAALTLCGCGTLTPHERATAQFIGGVIVIGVIAAATHHGNAPFQAQAMKSIGPATRP
ncbi:MAG: hypothetical protein ACRD3Q_17390 [Terriglobales bacterium]